MTQRLRDRFRSGGAAPATYRELVALFEGDRDRADAWLAGQLAYTGDAATAEQLLTALETSGPPTTALAALGAPASSVAPQTLRLPDLLDSDPATLAAATSRVDFSSPRS